MRYAILGCLWIAVVCAHGCAQEANITPGVCGNFVLEPGEDCDQPGSACVNCRIVCVAGPSCNSAAPPLAIEQCKVPQPPTSTAVCGASGIDGTCCPDTMACGVDGICHAPSGTFSTSSITQSFDATEFSIQDINGDLIQDVYGPSPTTVEVRYGDPMSPLGSGVSVPSPEVSSVAAGVVSTPGFIDFEQDGTPGLVIPARAGLFAFDNSSGTPDPVVFPVNGADAVNNVGIVSGINHVQIAPVTVGGQLLGAIDLDYVATPATGAGFYQLNLLEVPTSTVPVTSDVEFAILSTNATPCGFKAAANYQLHGHALHPYVDGQTVRVPIPYGNNVIQVCVATANPGTGIGSDITIHQTDLANFTLALDGETYFANVLTSSGCPDLVVSIKDGAGNDDALILPGSGTPATNSCTVGSASGTGLSAPIPGRSLAAITLEPGVLGSTTSVTGIITSKGVYAPQAGAWVQVTKSTRDWTYAIVADFDNNGFPDFAVQTVGTDVEVFRQTTPLVVMIGTGSATIPQWSPFVISTDENLLTIAAGDFDGDGNEDIAVAASDTSSPLPIAPADLTLAFGLGDATFAPASFGAIDEPTALAAMNLFDASLPLGDDVCDDLLIARGGTVAPGPNPTTAGDPALLIADYGSTSRTLSGPFVYASTFDGQFNPAIRGVPIEAVGGSFGSNVGSATLPGIFAVFEPPIGVTLAASQGYPFVTFGYDGTTFQKSPEGWFPAATCKGAITGSCYPFNSYLQMRRDAGELLLMLPVGFTADSICGGYFINGQTVGSGGVPQIFAPPCGEIAGNGAATLLAGINTTALIDNDGTTAHLATSSIPPTATASSHASLWTVTVVPPSSSNPPPYNMYPAPTLQLTNPNTPTLDAELMASSALNGESVIGCARAVGIELGSRTVNGVTYGANQPEIVVACEVGTPSAGSGSGSGSSFTNATWQLFARYAATNGSTYYERVLDTGSSLQIGALQRGDINGDGIDDIVFTQIGNGAAGRTLEAILQCDGHGCSAGGQ
jgi:hypothetical protein